MKAAGFKWLNILFFLCLVLAATPLKVFGQVNIVKIPLANSSYTAQLRGVSGSNTAGQTLQGSFNSSDSLFHFSPTVTGRYELWVDVLGGSAYVKDGLWSGANGRGMLGAPDVEKLVSLSGGINGGGLDSAGVNAGEIKRIHLDADIIAKLDSTYILPDGVSLGLNGAGEMQVQNDGLGAKHLAIGSFLGSQFQRSFETGFFWELKPLGLSTNLYADSSITRVKLAGALDAILDSTGHPPDGSTINLNGSGELQVNSVNGGHVADSTLTWLDVHPTNFFGPDFYVESPLGNFRWALAENSVDDFALSPGTAVKRINGLQDTVSITGPGDVNVSVVNNNIVLDLNDDIDANRLLSGSMNYFIFDSETQAALFDQRVFYSFAANANIISTVTPGAAAANSSSNTLNGNVVSSFAFNTSLKSNVTVKFFSPDRAVGDSCFVYFMWFSLTQDQGLHSVVWQVDGLSFISGSNQGETYGNEATGTFFCQAGQMTVSKFTLHTGNNFIRNLSDNRIRFIRLYDDLNDTHSETVYLVSIFVEYKISN